VGEGRKESRRRMKEEEAETRKSLTWERENLIEELF
jgi:hypothetical protein